MYTNLKDVTLKTGEAAELGVLIAPDDTPMAAKLRTLLGHKGPIWQWQMEQMLSGAAAGVENRFFLLLKAGRPIANILCSDRGGLGIFAHVFTVPEERRKGAAELLQTALMADFKQRGGRALFLETSNPGAAALYMKHGFQPVEPNCGHMEWLATDRAAFEKELFAAAPVRHETFSFAHWPTLPALAMMQHPARLRIAGMGIHGPWITEGSALEFLRKAQQKQPDTRAEVAVSRASGVPVAIACVQPHAEFGRQVDVVDLFSAPAFEAELPALFARLAVSPERTAICYADPCWPDKRAVLAACGFTPEATLPRFLRSGAQALDLELWVRTTSFA
jgi:GNAT superfamily N-acetyltransferase